MAGGLAGVVVTVIEFLKGGPLPRSRVDPLPALCREMRNAVPGAYSTEILPGKVDLPEDSVGQARRWWCEIQAAELACWTSAART